MADQKPPDEPTHPTADGQLTADEAEAFAKQFKALWDGPPKPPGPAPAARPQDITPRGLGPVHSLPPLSRPTSEPSATAAQVPQAAPPQPTLAAAPVAPGLTAFGSGPSPKKTLIGFTAPSVLPEPAAAFPAPGAGPAAPTPGTSPAAVSAPPELPSDFPLPPPPPGASQGLAPPPPRAPADSVDIEVETQEPLPSPLVAKQPLLASPQGLPLAEPPAPLAAPAPLAGPAPVAPAPLSAAPLAAPAPVAPAPLSAAPLAPLAAPMRPLIMPSLDDVLVPQHELEQLRPSKKPLLIAAIAAAALLLAVLISSFGGQEEAPAQPQAEPMPARSGEDEGLRGAQEIPAEQAPSAGSLAGPSPTPPVPDRPQSDKDTRTTEPQARPQKPSQKPLQQSPAPTAAPTPARPAPVRPQPAPRPAPSKPAPTAPAIVRDTPF